MRGAVRAEWLKVRRRRMTWILLAVAPLVIVVFYALMFVATSSADQSPQEAANWEARLSVANLVTFGDAIVYRIVALLCAILAGSVTANEFGWRTILTFTTWTGDRRKLLAAKLVVIGGVAAALIVAGWAAVTASVVAITIADARFQPGDLAPALAGLAGGVAVTWLGAMVYAVVAGAIAVWTRSTAAAIAVPLGVLLLEPLGAAGLIAIGGLGKVAAAFTLSHNIDGLLAADGAIRGIDEDLTAYPSPLRALAFLALFTAITALLALRTLANRDIEE